MNKTANLIAHAMLGAIEAKVTGNHALAGALGAVTGEVSAELISQHLYNKAPSELTESEKKNVAALSQISAGIAGGIIGDSSAAGLSAAEIGKRAVENNSLGMAMGGYQVVNAISRNNSNCDFDCPKELEQLQLNMAEVQLSSSVVMLSIIAPELLGSSIVISGTSGAITEVIDQLRNNKSDFSQIDWTKVSISAAVGIGTRNMSIWGTTTTNTIVEASDSFFREDKMLSDTLDTSIITAITTASGGYLGRKAENIANLKYNPDRNKYKFDTLNSPIPIEYQKNNSIAPSVIGNALDNLSSSSKNYLDEKVKEWRNENR